MVFDKIETNYYKLPKGRRELVREMEKGTYLLSMR